MQTYKVKDVFLQTRCVNPTTAWSLNRAVEIHNRDVIELLIQYGANLEQMADDYNGETALFTAVRMRNTATVRQLLEQGANVNHRQINGRTALMSM